MKKLLFVINTLGTGGAEKALIELLEKIDFSKYSVDFFVLLNQGELIHDVPANVNILNGNYDDTPIYCSKGKKHLIKHVILSLLKKGCFLQFLGFFFQALLKALHEKKDNKTILLWQPMAYSAPRFERDYDLAVAFHEGGSTYYVSKYVSARKKVAFVHVDYEKAGYSRWLDREAYENIDRIYAVSNEVSNSFLKTYPEYTEKVKIFHNIINLEKINRKSMEFSGYEDGFNGIRILTVGRLCAQKALEYSIDAMKILKTEGKNVRWYVLGRGYEENRLKKLIITQGLGDVFFLLGNKANPYPYIAECDIYVHASKFEGKSIAVQEAQALSKPIIVSDCAGNREQVIHMYDGMMCELDSTKIAEAIMYMINNKDEAELMGKRAYERISSEFANNNELENMLGMA